MKPSSKIAELTQMIAPAVSACGVELWGIECSPQYKYEATIYAPEA